MIWKITNMDERPIEVYVDDKQPGGKGIRGVSNYVRGAQRSITRLKQLRFDPLEKLVKQYERLDEEIMCYKQIRAGTRIELLGNGKPRTFSYEVLMKMEEQLQTIAKELLRYGYGRVPEGEDPNAHKQRSGGLVVKLHRQGDVYTAGTGPEEDDDDDFQESGFGYIENGQ